MKSDESKFEALSWYEIVCEDPLFLFTESKKQQQKTKNEKSRVEVVARMADLAEASRIWCFSSFLLHPWDLSLPEHLALPGAQFANYWSQYHSFSIESVTVSFVFLFFSLFYISYTSSTLLHFPWLFNFPSIWFEFPSSILSSRFTLNGVCVPFWVYLLFHFISLYGFVEEKGKILT